MDDIASQVEPPVCPNCHIEMKWSRSALVKPAPATIAHLFLCGICGRTAKTKTTIRTLNVPPEKLSAPATRRAA